VDNLGLGGLFIRTPDPPPRGTFIQLLIDAPTGEVRARAAVQRSSAKQGMGVKFIAMEHGNLLGRPVQDQFTRNEVPQLAVEGSL
jgi:hypothetical protein